MKCPSPISVKDERVWTDEKTIRVPCGNCGACRSNRRADWSFRLSQELKRSYSAYFITLTYSEENLPYTHQEFNNIKRHETIPTLSKEHLTKFIKRLRKRNKKHTDQQFRYYAVGEYGTRSGRPHYHLISFNIPRASLKKLNQIWTKGNVQIGTVTDASIHYVTKFHVNAEKEDFVDHETGEVFQRIHEFATMSRRPGIGSNYIEGQKPEYHRETEHMFVVNNGFKQRMPRYYKNKVFDPITRYILSQENIDETDRRYWLEYDRLSDLGIQEPDHYMQVSLYKQAKKVNQKLDSGKI